MNNRWRRLPTDGRRKKCAKTPRSSWSRPIRAKSTATTKPKQSSIAPKSKRPSSSVISIFTFSPPFLSIFTMEPFSACHQLVDPEQYYRDCLYDVCACQVKLSECLCPTISAYAKECAQKGDLIDWIPDVRECGNFRHPSSKE